MEMNDRFLRACRREPVDATPVWFMRQAGRYMAEYRAIREKHSLLEICYQPELAAEVTLQPVRALGVDAAILFADILLPVIPLGLGLDFAKGEGPVIGKPVRTLGDLAAMRPVNAETDLGYVMEAIRILRSKLKVPLIGFCGGPFTVASYIIEGGSSREFLKTKTMMYSAPEVWRALMEKLSKVMADYLVAQIRAGAQAVQMFDSWVGALSPQDYENFVLPYSQKVLAAAKAQKVPVIHFGTNTTTLLPLMKRAGGDVIGLDWRIPLDDGWALLGHDVAVQGNLDPALLFAPRPEIKKRVADILRRAEVRPGHIFNLGHGILQHTPVENVKAVVDMVHEYSPLPWERGRGEGRIMELNPLGLVAAASTFLGTWFGHVAVRKIESISPTIWLPTASFTLAGIASECLALLTSNFLLSTALGILGFTFLWDALEFTRQQNRIKNGHAPANPNNPRHMRLMGEHAMVTTLDLLKRDPLGKPVSHNEAIKLITEH